MPIATTLFHSLWLFVVLATVGDGGGTASKSGTARIAQVDVKEGASQKGGKQTISITLNIKDGFYLIGHKTFPDFEHFSLQVSFHQKGKMVDAVINYPRGMKKEIPGVGVYDRYIGKIHIGATVHRLDDAKTPLEIRIRMQGYPINDAA